MSAIDKVNVQVLTKLCEYMLDGEPVFIIRAQDKAAPETIRDYIDNSNDAGGTNLGRSGQHLQRIVAWQKANPTRIKPAD